MSRSLGQASHPTIPVFMTPNVRNRDHGVVKQKTTQKQQYYRLYSIIYSELDPVK